METLISAPYGYALSATIKARVTANNQNGWSLVSDSNVVGAIAKTKPSSMLPVIRGEETTEKQV